MDFSKLESYLDSLSEKYRIPATDIIVRREHEVIFRHMTGFSDSRAKHPTSENDLYWMYSISKLFTCTAIMQLIEERKLSLNDNLSDFLPEFKHMLVADSSGLSQARQQITIENLLTMCAGLSYNINLQSIKDLQQASNHGASTRAFVSLLAKEPLLFHPGEHFQYSFCHDVLAAVLEVIENTSFSTYLEKKIFSPLGIKDTGFIPDKNKARRLQAQYTLCENLNHFVEIVNTNPFRLSDNYESGGAGLISSANDVSLLLDALANDGVAENGNRILSAKSIEMMRENRLSEKAQTDFNLLGRKGYSYGLGVRTLIDKNYSLSPIGEFGWDGAAGSYALIDPENKVSIFFAAHILGFRAFPHEIHPKIRNFVYEALS